MSPLLLVDFMAINGLASIVHMQTPTYDNLPYTMKESELREYHITFFHLASGLTNKGRSTEGDVSMRKDTWAKKSGPCKTKTCERKLREKRDVDG